MKVRSHLNFVRPKFEWKSLVREKNPPGWDKVYGKEFICVWLSALGIMPNRSSHNLDIFGSLMEPLPSPMPRLPLKEIISKFFHSFKVTSFVSSPVEVNNFYGLVLWKYLNLLLSLNKISGTLCHSSDMLPSLRNYI